MIRRPKPGEDEEDILRMQEEFLEDKNSQPSAQVVNLRKTEHQTTKRASPSASTRKPSKYAQAKGLTSADKRPRIENSTGSLMGDILEKNVLETEETPLEADDDKVYYPKVIPSILGDIVEKNINSFVNLDFKPMPATGFPVVTKRNPNKKPGEKTLKITERQISTIETMDVDHESGSNLQNTTDSKPINIPSKSYILSSSDADTIHNENVKVLKEMSEEEILKEQQKLLSTIDPTLVDFIKSKRKQVQITELTEKQTTEATEAKIKEKMDVESQIEKDSLWDNDVLSHPHVNKWVHFENLEKDKLEWMKGIEENRKAEPDKPYEARFDFKGYLLPYSMELTDRTKSLYHHGEEPHRPGYTIMELFELSRSTVTQQRVMALNTVAGILEYNSTGIYKNIIDIPISKMFFVIRIAMDENKQILLEPALKAMRNLLYNRIDESCLDALIGFEEGSYQPCLENDKSEIEELESKESELKDFHLAEIDLIAAVLRTDILQRLYYILDTVRPSFSCVQYSLQILIRLARDSIDTASKIVSMDHLMTTIVTNFIPNTSINFAFDPNIVYNGKPILDALKLMRILSLQCREIGEILIFKYDILRPISAYISSGVDGTYGLRLQIEAFCILSNLLNYGLAVDNSLSLCPLIITTLYKHVHGTDIFYDSSVISATHAAVVLQYINKLFNCNMINIDNYKPQIYPLLKDGVQKWLMQTSIFDTYTCGHLRLLCSALDCCKTILIKEKLSLKFLNDTLKILSQSKGFQKVVDNLVPSSNLLSGIEDKSLNVIKNLVSLGGSVIDSTQKVLPILNIASPVPFLVALFQLLNVVNEKEIGMLYINKVLNYLEELSKKPTSLSSNWFTRMEVEFVYNTIKLAIHSNISESSKDLIYSVASKLSYILRVDKKFELEYLFNNIIFNKHWFTADRLLNLVTLSEGDGLSKALSTVEDIKACYSKVVNAIQLEATGNIVLKRWQEPVLPRDWIYLPILYLYSRSQEISTKPEVSGEHANKLKQQEAIEKELIIRCSLEWILFNEICFPDLLNDIDVTDRFCRIMCVYLSDNSLFLDENIKILLKKCTQILFKKSSKFNFDKELTGLHNFQDFYTQFLEQFQSVSYGDATFATCVLVPLAQRHNVKWRKLLWSEYAGCLRALDCPESDLCYKLHDYLYPEETDESLLKCYFRALSSNLLRPGTIAHKIAQHHVDCFKKRQSNVNYCTE
ncbi:RNA polymerase II-associated protein 1 [Melitaea cinxia]|uniref:RNA polymerase II-associated protein 1 n=1 Tax=Melitaea cinxia TaxID=113334 RepID=UPI001E273F1E|nr:RNA polymerase II-associated protein 1 [Melitaea cinxia]